MRIRRWPVDSPHWWRVTRKKFPFDDLIMVELEVKMSIPIRSSAAEMFTKLQIDWKTLNTDLSPSRLLKISRYNTETDPRVIHWNGKVVIMTNVLTLAALEVVKWQLPMMTISSKYPFFCLSVWGGAACTICAVIIRCVKCQVKTWV